MLGQIDRYEIRYIKEKDAWAFYQAVEENRAYLSQYLDFAKSLSLEDTQRAIKLWQADLIRGRGFKWGLFDGSEFLAMCSLSLNSYDKRGEIGYWLVEKSTGQGLMTRMVGYLVSLAFNIYKLNKLTIKCVDTNTKSQDLAKKLGFTYEGTLRQHQRLNEEFRDLQVYSLLRSEWEERMPNENL